MGGTLGQLGTTYDDRAARGGPAVRQDKYISPWFFINGDDRRSIVPFFNANFFRGNDGRSWSTSFGPSFDFKLLRPIQLVARVQLVAQRPRQPVVRALHRHPRRRSVHLRAPRPDDDVGDDAAELHLHAERVAAGIRAAVRVEGHVHERARALGHAARRATTTTATPRSPTRRSRTIRAASTSRRSSRTSCSAGSTRRAPRCSPSGTRAARGTTGSRGRTPSRAT